MNNILIIPDVHGRKFWKEAVEKYPDTPIIFIGDYHDPYPSEYISEEDSLANFREIIDYADSNENVQLLLGNHDLHYLCNFGEGCRIDYENMEEIRSILLENICRMKIADLRKIGDKTVLFSHAPILTDWIKLTGLSDNPEEIVSRLNDLLSTIVTNPYETEKMIGQISAWRGGYDFVGSPIWADMREITDNIIPDVDYCVFGHTQQHNAVITDRWANLDCRKAFIIDSELTLQQI